MATKEPGAPQQQQPLAKGRGIVKSVLSGDTVIIQDVDKPSSYGPPPEKQITFSALSAPRLGRPRTEDKEATPDEPFAWESREFLRKKCIGKKVVYNVEYVNPTNGREYGTVYLVEANESLNNIVVAEGWASIFKSSTGKESKRPDMVNLIQLEDAAQQAGRGIFSQKADTAVRQSPKVDAFPLYNQLKGKQLNAIVEQVRTGTTLRVTLLPTFHNFIVLLSGAQSPGFKRKDDGSQEPEPFAREAKHFVETNVLQRDVLLTLEGVDKQGNFFGSIELQGRDVAEELLKGGLASYVAWSATTRGAAWAARLKAAEKGAKDTRKRMWVGHVEKGEQAQTGSLPREFVGKVTGVVNPGALTILPEVGGLPEQTIALSSIRVPRGSYPGDEADEAKLSPKEREEVRAEKAWAAEGKEFLRKRIIGQKVKVVFDYLRKAQKKENANDLPEKAYYSVYQGDVNIAVALAEAGLVKAMEYKAGDDRTNDYELLLLAENKAKNGNKGWHGPADKAPSRRLNELTIDANDPKTREKQIVKAKGFLPFLERGGPHKAIIEYVFSGGRYKVYVPGQSCVISLSLSGVKVPKRGESEEYDALSNEALQWARSKLHQREVSVEIEAIDKGGNFVGEVYTGKGNSFGVQLVTEGYAAVHYPTAERMKNGKVLIEAESKAKRSRKNLWKNYDPEEEKRKQKQAEEDAQAMSAGVVGSSTEFLDVIVTEVLTGAHFYLQVVNDESASLDDLVANLTQLSTEEGPVPDIEPKVNDIVRARFTDDDSWYRARVVQALPERKYKVVYFDYGNSEIISANRIRALPHGYQTLPVQAQEAALAFVKAPSLDSEWGRESQQALKELAGGRRLMAAVEYRDGGVIYVSLADPEAGIHVNTSLVRAGLARVKRQPRRYQSHPLYVKLREEEEKAKASRAALWQYGDAPDSDDDEDEPRGAWGKGAPSSAAPKKK